MKKTLTEEQEAHYVKEGGKRCPHCGMLGVEACITMEVDGPTATCEVQCEECGGRWRDVYTLSGILDRQVTCEEDGAELQGIDDEDN